MFYPRSGAAVFGWRAGLALGESTPGPLIMVNTLVGLAAGYNVEGRLAWGVASATIRHPLHLRPVSFVFNISGARIIDRIRYTGSFANSLNGITIAVVAVFVARGAGRMGSCAERRPRREVSCSWWWRRESSRV